MCIRDRYMTDLLEYCKAQGVEKVLFARFPHEKEIKLSLIHI